jgi:hypothetical protein
MNTSPHFSTISNRLDRLRARRIDSYEKQATLNEVYDRMSEQSSAVKYAIGAMQPIDPAYTANTYKEGDRVKNQLETAGLACAFEYQGSVTCDIHIKAHSDIDLLTLTCKWEMNDAPVAPGSRYGGNWVDDLLALRRDSIDVLRRRFPEAAVDSSGSKSVSIEGGSLRRKIDVVSSNWRNTIEYNRTGQLRDRGVDVFDSTQRDTIKNLPFLHNDRIDTKDKRTMGGLRKAIRLLKSLKYDSTTGVEISSYDIAAVAYAMDDSRLLVSRGLELVLVENCKQYLDFLAENQSYRESLDVPNGTRRIFGTGGATAKGLGQLRNEVGQLLYDIQHDFNRSFRKLAEARLEYS